MITSGCVDAAESPEEVSDPPRASPRATARAPRPAAVGAWRRRLSVAALAVAAVSACGWGGYRYWKRRTEAAKLKKLVETKVRRGEFIVVAQAAAVVEPLNKVPVAPAIGGRIEKLLVREGDRVRAGQIVAWMSSTERAAILDAARAQGAAELAKWEDAFRPTPIVAPVDGEVIKRFVSPGQTVTADQETFTLSDRLIVKTFVDESDIAKVRIGQKAEYVLDAFLTERQKGEVATIAYDSSQQNNVTVFEVKIRPRGGAERLRSGMTAEVYIETERKKDALYLPKRAVKYKEGETYVLVRPAPDATPVERKVNLGASNERFAEVLSGLSAGETVMMPASPVPDEDEHAVEFD